LNFILLLGRDTQVRPPGPRGVTERASGWWGGGAGVVEVLAWPCLCVLGLVYYPDANPAAFRAGAVPGVPKPPPQKKKKK
jgi:hypothetical protein